MEEFETLDFEESKEDKSLIITNQIKNNFNITSGWAIFMSVFGFVMSALILFGAMAIFMLIGSSPFYSSSNPMIFMAVIYLLIAGGTTLIMVYLLKFSIKIRKAIRHSHQHSFLEATENLKQHYKMMGVFVIVLLGMYLMFMVLLMSRVI